MFSLHAVQGFARMTTLGTFYETVTPTHLYISAFISLPLKRKIDNEINMMELKREEGTPV